MTIQFNNVTYPAGYVGEDDGVARAAAFGIDNVSTGPITINGTINQAGDFVTFTGTLPADDGATVPTTNNRLYATGFDNSGMVLLSNTYPSTSSSFRIVLSNTALSSGQRVGFDNDPQQTEYTPAPPCFTTGTLIRTTRGEVAVEDLRVGDVAVTASGRTRPITWIGHRNLDGNGKALPHNQQPIRVRAGAFGSGLPTRDLCLSQGHPVLVGADADGESGVLVPIMCLINGTSIVREPAAAVTYWHVELDRHDILLAEGLAAESYLDWGDRPYFAEGSDHALHNPDFVVPGLSGRCRPVAIDGAVVEAERARLDAVFAAELASHSAWGEADAFWQAA